MTAQKFRKKPVEIDAMPWDGTAEGATPIIDWILNNGGTARFSCAQPDSGPCKPEKPHTIAIDTLEGSMHASPGDWIIRGVQGEFYPCKPDIFATTYSPATNRDQHCGLYRKYELRRVNEDGTLRYVVADPWFALRYTTDDHARVALEAYADSCASEYPKLAEDLYRALGIDVEVAPVDLTESLARYLAEVYQGRWVAVREGSLIAAGDSIERARAGVTDGQRYAVLYVPREGESKADVGGLR